MVGVLGLKPLGEPGAAESVAPCATCCGQSGIVRFLYKGHFVSWGHDPHFAKSAKSLRNGMFLSHTHTHISIVQHPATPGLFV